MVLDLQTAIKADGRTLTDIALASGVDAGRLSRFVRGQRDLTFDGAAKVCEALGITFTIPERLRTVPAVTPKRRPRGMHARKKKK
jgi:transcriptional regulator with XRE-family HTH domain